MRFRRKHAAVAVALVGGSVLAASAFLFRNDIIEMWHLARLGSKDPEARRAALTALEPLASSRSVPALLAIVEEDGACRNQALQVLIAASPRMRSSPRREAVLFLRRCIEEGGEVLKVIVAVGPYRKLARDCPDLFPLLAEDLRGGRGTGTLRALAPLALIDAWPASRQAIFSFACEAQARDLLAFIGRGVGLEESMEFQHATSAAPEMLAPAPSSVADLLRALLRDHERPEARAAALGFAVSPTDLSALKEVYATDPSFIVRRAALRIAAHMRDAAGNLDLIALSRSEPDPALRAAAILARDVWSCGDRERQLVELWDGAPVTWLERPRSDWVEPWREEEIGALERILLESDHPALRDAASIALAGRHGRFIGSKRGPPSRDDLRVHEWSVLRNQGDDAILVTRATVFFDADTPVPLLVRMETREELPLESHPPRVDYLTAHPGLGKRAVRETDTLQSYSLPTPVQWQRRVISASLNPRSRAREGEPDPPRYGLDWCGLRVGYPKHLEPRPGVASPDSPRDLFRKASAKSVSLGECSERHLSYGGRLGVSSPLRAFREDADSRLLLAVRPLDGIPLDPGTHAALAPIPTLLVIEKRPDQPARAGLLENLDGDTAPRAVDLRAGLDLDEGAILAALRGALGRAGLAPAEADSLIDGSRKEILEADGLRIAWLLPRWLHDELAGLTVLPTPREVVRVGLVVDEPVAVSTGSPTEDRALLWQFEPGARNEVKADFTEDALSSLPSEPLLLEHGIDGIALDISADGSRALIQRHSEHYIADLEAKRLIRLTPVKSPAWWPALSADGKHVAFSSWVGDEYRVRAADLERGTLHTIALDLQAFPRVTISGDGRRLGVCSANDGIHVLDLETRRAWFIRVGVCRDAVLELSGDGRRAVSIRPEGNDDEDILLVDLETGGTLDVSRSVGRELHPSISWDGNRIAFVRLLPAQQGVWVADVEARSRARVSPPVSGAQFPSLSADGSHVVFTAGGKVWVRELSSGSLREAGSSEGGVGAHVSNDGRRTVFTRRDAEGFHVRFDGAERP